ncbi:MULTISPECIES: hypothetical protein [Thalassospira]|uniref:Uncharacterized protein n=2 Tax=Thalassospira TaxID=168934 RepID=A0A367W8M5_9PROT|nr:MULTISPECIES: hypothetical protein [Thalassospira]MDG4718015.1 hypothetical protein [Thalassospira sp. FZY0004]RCK37796.1 hypothetical protein TH19_07080 [Thalassospira profundimaris]
MTHPAIEEGKVAVITGGASDIPNDAQMLYSELSGEVRELRGDRSHFANGTALDAAGGLLMCEHGTRSAWLF